MGALLEYVLGEGINNQKDLEHWTGLIKQVGPENDPAHAENRFYAAQLDVMMKTNPARLLGLEKW